MNRRQVLRAAGAVAFGSTVAGCTSAGQSDGPRRVSMTGDFAFDPKRLTVRSGTTVRWVNDSTVGHTVTAYDDGIPADATYFASGGFESERAARNNVSDGLLAAGETYEHTFTVAGTYEYVCIPHESSGMVGTVVVRE